MQTQRLPDDQEARLLAIDAILSRDPEQLIHWPDLKGMGATTADAKELHALGWMVCFEPIRDNDIRAVLGRCGVLRWYKPDGSFGGCFLPPRPEFVPELFEAPVCRDDRWFDRWVCVRSTRRKATLSIPAVPAAEIPINQKADAVIGLTRTEVWAATGKSKKLVKSWLGADNAPKPIGKRGNADVFDPCDLRDYLVGKGAGLAECVMKKYPLSYRAATGEESG